MKTSQLINRLQNILQMCGDDPEVQLDVADVAGRPDSVTIQKTPETKVIHGKFVRARVEIRATVPQ